MMRKKVLITGALGQLGYAVSQQLRDTYELCLTDISKDQSLENYSYLDISDKSQIDEYFIDNDPDIIINLASFTNVDQCELQPVKAKELNIMAVEALIEKNRGKFIHISSDYVFDGIDGPYYEDDNTNPINIYGQTKLESEKIISENLSDWCIIRTNVLFDYHKRTKASFIKWVIDSLKSEKIINVVYDQWNNPTWTKNFAEVIELVLKKDVKGLYHYGGADYLNRYDFALLIAEIFNLNKRLINPISTESLKQVAKRPLKSGLKTDKIEETLNIKCHKLSDSLLKIKTRMMQ